MHILAIYHRNVVAKNMLRNLTLLLPSSSKSMGPTVFLITEVQQLHKLCGYELHRFLSPVVASSLLDPEFLSLKDRPTDVRAITHRVKNNFHLESIVKWRIRQSFYIRVFEVVY